jgi:predicted acylesterase/phospholipase RssA
MSRPILADQTLTLDRNRIGISYSGGGALLLIELGIAQAFIEMGVQPYAIAGVSAGAIAGTAHAIDPVKGRGILAAAKGLEQVSDRSLGLTLEQMALKAVWERSHLAALGSNESIQNLLDGAFREIAGQPRLTFDYFGRDGRPKLLVGATDRLAAERVEFAGDTDVGDGLVASSAIPGVFPAKQVECAGQSLLLVDGGVVGSQPLSTLALLGCGTIFACAVGYGGERLQAPANLIDNWQQSLSITLHEAARLEEEYVQSEMGDQGVIYHIHPEVAFPVKGFNFTADVIASVMREANDKTKQWITDKNLLAGTVLEGTAVK